MTVYEFIRKLEALNCPDATVYADYKDNLTQCRPCKGQFRDIYGNRVSYVFIQPVFQNISTPQNEVQDETADVAEPVVQEVFSEDNAAEPAEQVTEPLTVLDEEDEAPTDSAAEESGDAAEPSEESTSETDTQNPQ